MSHTSRPAGAQSIQPRMSRSTPVVVALVVLLCIGATVALALLLRDDDGAPGSSGGQAQSTGTPGDCGEAPEPVAQPEQFQQAPDPAEAEGATREAVLATNCGDITLELFGDQAPQAVASFSFLAEEGYFDDSPCHRLTTSGLFVLQCGDPTGSGTGGPGYTFGVENAPKDGSYATGTLAMARSTDPNSNGSQFFIVYDDTSLPVEGGGYTIFGKVIDGLDVVTSVADEGVAGGGADGAPAQPLSVLGVSVSAK